ncbi:hypothetical protein [Nonomuraea dietziae]|uniref:hypothetical protein n=1 Tax=Nonomuraea dietziae TaxID=65515 RepID=UPI0033D893E2
MRPRISSARSPLKGGRRRDRGAAEPVTGTLSRIERRLAERPPVERRLIERRLIVPPGGRSPRGVVVADVVLTVGALTAPGVRLMPPEARVGCRPRAPRAPGAGGPLPGSGVA